MDGWADGWMYSWMDGWMHVWCTKILATKNIQPGKQEKQNSSICASPNKNDVNLFHNNWFNLLPEKMTSWTALRVQLSKFYYQILISASSFCWITNLYISKNDLGKQVETECSEDKECMLRFDHDHIKPAWLYDRNCSQRLESARVCPDVMFACSLNCDLQGIVTHISTHMFCVNVLLQRE